MKMMILRKTVLARKKHRLERGWQEIMAMIHIVGKQEQLNQQDLLKEYSLLLVVLRWPIKQETMTSIIKMDSIDSNRTLTHSTIKTLKKRSLYLTQLLTSRRLPWVQVELVPLTLSSSTNQQWICVMRAELNLTEM